MQVFISLAPVYIPEGNRSRSVLIILDRRRLICRGELVQHDTETEHVDRLVYGTFTQLWRHISERADSLHIEPSIIIKVAAETEVAKFGHIVLFFDVGRLLQDVLKFYIRVHNALLMHVV